MLTYQLLQVDVVCDLGAVAAVSSDPGPAPPALCLGPDVEGCGDTDGRSMARQFDSLFPLYLIVPEEDIYSTMALRKRWLSSHLQECIHATHSLTPPVLVHLLTHSLTHPSIDSTWNYFPN